MTAIFVPATHYSHAVARPSCSECGAATLLVGIEPEQPDYDLYTFECPNCQHYDTAVGKIRSRS